jgi:hypothetical protein
MSGDNPSMNINVAGDWSKPVIVFVEKISAAIGGYAKPFQIKRVAQAKADAAKIAAVAQIEVAELQQRALHRFAAEQTKMQDNIEAITRKALPGISDQAKTEIVEDDWITNFFDKCRIISDAEMQSLWARVLTGEANAPGTFSKRTVNFLASLDKADATFITSFYGFCWMIDGLVPLILDVTAPIYNYHRIDFDALRHLESIELVTFEPLAGYTKHRFPRRASVHYYGTPFFIDFSSDDVMSNKIDIGKTMLTSIGHQLAPISGSQAIPGFTDYVLDKWISQGLVLSSPWPRLGPY